MAKAMQVARVFAYNFFSRADNFFSFFWKTLYSQLHNNY